MYRQIVTIFAAGALLGACGADNGPSAQAVAREQIETISGVYQDGYTLGSVDAPATLTMYASFDDFNGAFLRNELPELVREYIRPGRVRLIFRTVTEGATNPMEIEGAVRLARTAQGVGLQDHLWDFYLAHDAMYVGTLDEQVVDAALSLIPGLDREQVREDARSDRVGRAIARADAMAVEDDVEGLPAFFLEGEGEGTRRVRLNDDCEGCLLRSIDTALQTASALDPRKVRAGRKTRSAKPKPSAASRPTRTSTPTPVRSP